jgi:hypothetical protein
VKIRINDIGFPSLLESFKLCLIGKPKTVTWYKWFSVCTGKLFNEGSKEKYRELSVPLGLVKR